MTIRGLQQFLQERRQISTSSISELRNQRVGVDGNTWLKKVNVNEPLYNAIGGFPPSVCSAIQDELKKLNAAHLKPLIVFNGVNLARKDRNVFGTQRPDTLRSQKLTNAWEAYHRGDIKTASTLFQESEKYSVVPHFHNVFKFLKEQNVDFFRAPYLAWAQIAWFSQQDMVQAVYGSLELLLFGVQRLIIDFDFEKGTFEWVEMKSLLRDLDMSFDQFAGACILAGLEWCGTFPPINKDVNKDYIFGHACEIVRHFRSAHAAVQFHINSGMKPVNYLDTYQRAWCILRNNPILLSTCVIEPSNKESCPNDLHEAIGPRFPNDLFFIISQGAFMPHVVNTLIGSAITDWAPLSDSEEYRAMLEGLLELRSSTTGLLASNLHDHFRQRQLVSIRWFDAPSEQTVQHQNALTHQLREDLRTFSISVAELSAELVKIKRDSVDFSSVILVQSHRAAAGGGPIIKALETRNAETTVYNTLNEAIFCIKQHILQLRDYLSNDRRPSVLGKAFEGVSPKYQDETFLVVELVKMSLLPSPRRRLSVLPSNEPAPVSKEITLLTRVISLLAARQNAAPWTGPVDLDLLTFHEAVKVLFRSLRNHAETAALVLILRRRILFENPHDYNKLAYALPFFQQANTASGVLVKHFLTTNATIASLTAQFPNIIDVKEALNNAYEFWQDVMRSMTALKDLNTLPADIYAEFHQANSVLLAKRSLLK